MNEARFINVLKGADDDVLKRLALAKHLNEEVHEKGGVFYTDEDCTDELDMDLDDTYKVLTDSEADDEQTEYAKYYLDDCVLPEIPSHLRGYFDDEAWISDYLSCSDRGSDLASYDGEEHEVSIGDRTFYIYRIN